MRSNILAMSVTAPLLFIAAPALAQSADPSVSDYLCQFAGKCGDDTTLPAFDEEETREAPATKGFRLARKGQEKAAPDTRGFRIAGPSPKPAASPAPARPVAATPRPAARAPARPARAAAPASAAQPVSRSDLMVAFGLGSADLTAQGQRNVRTFAQALQTPELSGQRFLIAGHTDSLGDRAANVALSQRRAQAVADLLVAEGVDRSRIEVTGYGPAQPLPGRAASDPANRRVEAQPR